MVQYVCSLKRGNFKVGCSGDTVREVIVVMPINKDDGNANHVIMMGMLINYDDGDADYVIMMMGCQLIRMMGMPINKDDGNAN
jgi:hypothetical protein